MKFLSFVKIYWKTLVIIFTPIVLLPIPIVPLIPINAAKCAFVVGIMAVYWGTEVIPLAATAFFPVILYPLFGVLDAKTTSVQYLNDSNFVFIGSLIVAVGIEESKLHKRIALRILLLMGSDVKWIMLGLQIATAFLSMWMSNTATTAMMMPIVVAVIKELAAFKSAEDGVVIDIDDVDILSRPTKEVKMLYPNQTDLSFATWMAFSFPQMLVLLLCSWLLLQTWFIGICSSFFEAEMVLCLVLLIILWLTRDPKLIDGWDVLFEHGYVTDGTSAMFVGCLLFFLPRNKPRVSGNSMAIISLESSETAKPAEQSEPERVMSWKIMEQKFSWGIMLLLGGGYAMAKGVTASGLSEWLGDQLSGLGSLSTIGLLSISITLVTFMTEFTSNVACATITIPIIGSLAQSLHINPLYTMLPIACSCSFAFMLPVATPPNAIVFASGLLKVTDMVFAGFIMSWISIGIVTLNMSTYATWLLNLNAYPDWALYTVNATTTAIP